jgi:hypothetical protein
MKRSGTYAYCDDIKRSGSGTMQNVREQRTKGSTKIM